jgi:hypothetical protein
MTVIKSCIGRQVHEMSHLLTNSQHGPATEDYILTSKNLLFSTKEELYSHLLKKHSPQDVANTLANIVDFGLLDED